MSVLLCSDAAVGVLLCSDAAKLLAFLSLETGLCPCRYLPSTDTRLEGIKPYAHSPVNWFRNPYVHLLLVSSVQDWPGLPGTCTFWCAAGSLLPAVQGCC